MLRLISRLAITLFVGTAIGRAALTHIQGVITYPDGSHPSGYYSIQSQAFTNAQGVLISAVNLRNIQITDGVIDTFLEPNIGATPAGTSYRIAYNLNGSTAFQRIWYVPASNSIVPLQNVEFPIPGLVGTTAVVNPTQLLQAGANPGQVLAWNGSYWAPGAGGGGGSPLFSSILTGTNTTATMTVGSGASLTYTGTGSVNANSILSVPITGIAGAGGRVQFSSGAFTTGHLFSIDASGSAIDSGIPAGLVLQGDQSYPNPPWITSLAASKISGSLICGNLPALTGDATTSAGTCVTSVLKTGGVSFSPSATTDTTNAANITSGTLSAARLPAINLAASGAGGVTGNLPVTNLAGGVGASSTTVWYGDGTWRSIAAGGTVTNSLGPLVAGNLIIGNSGNDITILNSIGTSVTVLHGNSGGTPSWGSVSLTTDVSGILPAANGGLGTSSIAFTGPSGGVKTFTLPNASSTILTNNASVTLAQGGTGADFSAIVKGGLLVGTASNTLGIKTIGADGQVLTADAASTGGMKWAAVVGTGTVTSIATTGPITGGTITTTGTIACPTCVTSAAALTANQLVIGGGSQASVALGSLGTTTTVLHGNSGGVPSFATVALTTDVSGVLPFANGGTPWSSVTGGINYAGGKVGVGASSPAFQVDVSTSTNVDGLRIKSSLTPSLRIDSGSANAASRNWAFETNRVVFGDFAVMRSSTLGGDPDAGTIPVYISPTGNVGVGTSAPGQPLSVAGTIESTTGGYKYPDAATRTAAPAKVAEASNYDFAALTPTGSPSITAGSNTVTIPLAPPNVALTVGYKVYISGGTGTAEAAAITASACTAGATACSLTFTAANTHSGAYALHSASGGIQECILANAGTNGGTCHIQGGVYNVYSPILIAAGNQIALKGDGMENTTLHVSGDGLGTIDNNATGLVVEDIGFEAGTQQTTGGYAIRLGNASEVFFNHFNRIRVDKMYDGILAVQASQWWVTNSRFYNFAHVALTANESVGAGDAEGPQITNNIFFVYTAGLFADSCLKVIRTGVIFFSHNFCAGNSDGSIYLDYGVNLASTASTGIIIDGNDFQTISTAPVGLSGTWDSVTISNNVIDQAGYTDNAGRYGFLIQNGSGTGVKQGTITGNQIQGPGSTNFRGIDLEGAAGNWTITGNSFNHANTGLYLNQSGGVTVGPNNMLNVTTPVQSFSANSIVTSVAPMTYAQMTFGTFGNGSQVYATDANSTCSAGGSTGRTCFRENGAWVH